jgi:hypothetical protein
LEREKAKKVLRSDAQRDALLIPQKILLKTNALDLSDLAKEMSVGKFQP